MLAYRSEVKIGVLMALGLSDPFLVANITALDVALIKSAGKVLTKAETLVFFYLWHCSATWNNVQNELDKIGKALASETIKGYARDAKNRLSKDGKDSEPLQKWYATYLLERQSGSSPKRTD